MIVGDGDEHETRQRAGGGAAGDPRRGRARQALRRQHATDAADDRRRERGRTESLDERARQDGAPLDGREQQVTDVGRFDRQRSAVAAAAQAERDGQHGHQAEHGWAVAEHRSDL